MKWKIIIVIALSICWGNTCLSQGLIVEPNTNLAIKTGTTLDICSGDLMIESDAVGDASLVDNGNISFSGGGQAYVQRYITEGAWHLISSPVINATANIFMGDYLQFHSENNNSWTDISSGAYQLAIMQGYAFWSTENNPSVEVFSGTTNTGLQSYAFTENGDGWNLIGNPYPSVLDWDAVTIPYELSGAIWLFDPTIGSYGDYRYYINDGGGANTTSQFIPSGQGFFVKANNGPGTFQLDITTRVHGSQIFYKSTISNELLVIKAMGNNITTQTAIRFNQNATSQIDRLYDVQKIVTSSPDVPVVYTKCDGELMSINTLPSISGNEIVPLFFEAGQSGNYVFQATELQSIDSTIPVYLEDITQNYFQDFRINPEYSFSYTTGLTKEFNVHFENITTTIQEHKMLDVLCYMVNGVLFVQFMKYDLNQEPFEATITVYNLVGQKVIKTYTFQTENEIILNADQSMYLVQINTNVGFFTSKVFNL